MAQMLTRFAALGTSIEGSAASFLPPPAVLRSSDGLRRGAQSLCRRESPRKLRVVALLPPGIAKRYLPQDLLVRYHSRPGCHRVVVDNDVVLIAAATGLIVDILNDVL
jgi:hypothetical protein